VIRKKSQRKKKGLRRKGIHERVKEGSLRLSIALTIYLHCMFFSVLL